MRLTPLAFLLACSHPQERQTQTGLTLDEDNDGFTLGDDCDDRDPLVNPGVMDFVGDGLDLNCDGHDGVDADLDGFASLESGGIDCDDTDPIIQGADADLDGVPSCTDCDDDNPDVSPALSEVCDGVDTDCDGLIDRDADGIGVCSIQLATDQLDLLFIIDNSCSMSGEQMALAGAAPALFSAFASGDLDFHVGVVTTDMGDHGWLREVQGARWIDNTTPTPADLFQVMVQMGTVGSPTEQGVDAAHTALGEESEFAGFNEGFHRGSSDLGVVVVSDENDFSDVTPPEFLTFLDEEAGGVGLAARVHAAVTPDGGCPTGSTPGTTYTYLANQAAGELEDICTLSWESFLNAIVENHRQRDRSVIQLSNDVVLSSLAVDVTTSAGTERLLPPDVS